MNNIALSIFIEKEGSLKIEKITSISKDNFDELFGNEKLMLDFLSISNLYQICRINSNELLKSITDFETKLIDKNLLIMADDVEKLNTNRLLLNYLFSFRTYIDHLETFVKRTYGKNSDQTKEFKAITNKLYFENFAYKFFYNLRNYAQHCGLPIDIFEIQSSISNDKYSVKIIIGFNVENLITKFDDWREPLKTQMKEYETLDLINNTNDFAKLIQEIDTWAYNLLSTPIQLVKEKVKTLSDGKYQNTKNLCITYYDEPEKVFVVDSTFRYITQIENYR
jgi:hypothetical protein